MAESSSFSETARPVTVVSSSSPISYLVLIGEEDLLPALYGHVLIPEAVRQELSHPEGPEPVREWMLSSPSWITTREGLSEAQHPRSRRSGEEDLTRLDPGERDAILLAERGDAGLLLVDERAGRDAARNRELTVTGTIGVLRAALKKGHVDAAPVAKALRDTTFRASFDLYRWLLDQQE